MVSPAQRDPTKAGADKSNTHSAPLPELPAYTARQSLSRPPRRELTTHTYELKDGKGRPWFILNVASRARSSPCLPHFYEGDQVNGSVNLNLEKETQVKSVSVMLHGEIIATHNVRYTFLRLTKELWSVSKNSPSVNMSGERSSRGKSCGRFSWPFSLAIPSEIELMHQRTMQVFRLPASFYVRGARVTVRYQICATVARGMLQVNSELGSQMAYTPIIRPDPPSLARQLSYQEQKPLVGPDGDPEGWHRITPVVLGGSIFSNRAVDIQLTLWIAKPLCYTRGSVIPLILDIECSDQQALDILSSPKSPQVRLIRTLTMGYDADWGRAGHSTRQINLVEDTTATTSSGDLVDELQSAVWWNPARERGAHMNDRHTLFGELHLGGSLSPSSYLGYFSVTYTVALHPPQAVGFTAKYNKKMPLRSVPVSIATVYPRCPRPIAYSPPDYASLHSDSADSRVYDAIVYG